MTRSEDVCLSYDFELDRVTSYLTQLSAKRVLLQLPEGLQRCAALLSKALKERVPGLEVYVSANPSQGPCLVDLFAAGELSADVIVHFGHLSHPLYGEPPKTLFIAASYEALDRSAQTKLLLEALREICDELTISKEGKPKICVATTFQHLNAVKEIVEILAEETRCTLEFKGALLGCSPVKDESCNAIVVVAGGRFHCLSQALSLVHVSQVRSTRVKCVDPYTNAVWDPESEMLKVIKVRLWKMAQAARARKWLIVDGFYGQHRPKLVETLASLIERRGGEYLIVKALKVDRELLLNLGGSEAFDAIIVVACPYIPFELADFDKPVLTPGEALEILSGDEVGRYRYPW